MNGAVAPAIRVMALVVFAVFTSLARCGAALAAGGDANNFASAATTVKANGHDAAARYASGTIANDR